MDTIASDSKVEVIKPGIRGWLIIVAIGVVVAPLWALSEFVFTYLPMFFDGTWDVLTNPESLYYIEGFRGLAGFEISVNTILLIAGIYLVFLFFRKDRRFPKFYIVFLAASLILVILGTIIAYSTPSVADLLEPKDNSALGRALSAALIWIPYIMRSKQVKATFVN